MARNRHRADAASEARRIDGVGRLKFDFRTDSNAAVDAVQTSGFVVGHDARREMFRRHGPDRRDDGPSQTPR